MSGTENASADGREESLHREYVLDVRIVEVREEGESRYRFEAPRHAGATFDEADAAELYADVYFDANGFQEEGTGPRGVPPEVVQAGKDTLAAYFLTRSGIDCNWMASFYGVKPAKVRRYVSWVRERADEVRAGVAERDLG